MEESLMGSPSILGKTSMGSLSGVQYEDIESFLGGFWAVQVLFLHVMAPPTRVNRTMLLS
jgi:hypothetical protein